MYHSARATVSKFFAPISRAEKLLESLDATDERGWKTVSEKRSRGEEYIESLMAQLDPASERYRVLASARRFKSSWVELGEKLLQVQSREAFRDWGYPSFDDYCAKEVRIRKPTAEKLTQAYRFLEREEPELLARQVDIRPLPDFRSVDLLRQARELPGLQEESYRELHDAVMDGTSHATIARQFRQATVGLAPASDDQPLRQALAAARRLLTLLDALPAAAGDDRESVVGLIERLAGRLAALQSDEPAAAPPES